MRGELSKKESWESIAAQLRVRGLPKRGRPKKDSADADFDRLADALLIRTERVIAELKLNEEERSYLIRVLRSRLRSIATVADQPATPRKP